MKYMISKLRNAKPISYREKKARPENAGKTSIASSEVSCTRYLFHKFQIEENPSTFFYAITYAGASKVALLSLVK